MPKKKRQEEEIADQAIANAKAMKEVAQQNVREQLVETFAPQLKKMISNSILEMDDEDMEDMDMEDMDEMGMYEEEEDDVEAGDVDAEDLEDLESALDEEEDLDGDGHVEVPTDEDDPEDEEEMEEGTDYEDMEEESTEDFMAELQAILNEEEEEEEEGDYEDSEKMDEIEGKKNGDSFDQDAPPESYHTKDRKHGDDTKPLSEGGKDGGSHTEDGEDSSYHTKKFEDADVERIVSENRKLKRALKEINDSLNETVLDNYKTKAFKNIVNKHKLSETAKLRVMRAIDEGKSEREVDRISSVFESTLPSKGRSKKKKVNESKGGRNSSIRKPKGKNKKSMNESTGKKSVGYDWAGRLAELADIKK